MIWRVLISCHASGAYGSGAQSCVSSTDVEAMGGRQKKGLREQSPRHYQLAWSHTLSYAPVPSCEDRFESRTPANDEMVVFAAR
jgi:hypothetical protein